MDTASGVYLHIKDSSFETAGSSSLVAVIPMTTLKGQLGINDVSATTFKDILGYDLAYNSNYYGLERILEQVSHAYVWRLNQNAKLGNAYFESTSSDKAFNDDAEVFEDITKMDPAPILAIANKDVGDWETTAIKFAPTEVISTVINENPTQAISQEIVLEDVNANELKELFGKEVLGSCIFYNASDNSIVGIIKKDENDEWKVYRVVDGEIVDDVIETVTTETNIWTDGTNFYRGNLEIVDEPEGDASTPVELGTIRLAATPNTYYQKKVDDWFAVTRLTITAIETSDTAETDTDIIAELEAASDITISYVKYTYTREEVIENNAIGNAVFDENKLTITLSKSMSTDTFWSVHTIPSTINDWTLIHAVYDGRNYSIKNEVEFSFNVEADNYIENVDFGTLQVYAPSPFPATWETIRDYFTLEGGTNGDRVLSAIDIDTSVLDDVSANVMLMNGLTDYRIVNRLGGKCEKKKIHLFADAPAYSSYVDLYEWSKKIMQSQYVAIAARPDQQLDSTKKTFYVYPSVSYAYILANMITNYGSLCYPPAGATYGNIVVDNLIKCDYPNFADEMKTYRINWQLADSDGTMMWEQRTTYSLDSDLSYIAPVFIVDDLSDRIVRFEKNFNFRYTSRTDLLNQDSGLKGILDDFVSRGFVYDYDVRVPSYEEAQAAGRTLVIKIKVQVAKDSEVIEIELELING